MNTILKSQILPFINAAGTSKRDGATANVYLYQDHEKKYAYKEYKYKKLGVDKCELMESHIKQLFVDFTNDTIKKMRAWGSIPLYLVYEDDNDTFCGFVMDRLPDSCYEEFDSGLYGDGLQECSLDSFFCYVQEYSDKELAEYINALQGIVRFFHKREILLGDVLSAANTCVQKTEKGLFPYLIDVDSLMRGNSHPLGTYDSNNYIPPQEDIRNRSKKTDIYKLSYITLRLFSTPDLPPERANLLFDIQNNDVKKSLERIEKAIGKEYKEAVISGLSENPNERPSIDEFIRYYKNSSRKLQEICDIIAANLMTSGEDYYSYDKLHPEDGVLITLQGIHKIEGFFHIDNINDPENKDIWKGMKQALIRKIKKTTVVEPTLPKPTNGNRSHKVYPIMASLYRQMKE